MLQKIFFLLSLILVLNLDAQTGNFSFIEGKVLDENKNLLADVVVQDSASSTVAITDAKGVFRMNLTKGNKKFYYKKLGYSPIQTTYQILEDSTFILEFLSKRVKQLPIVEINAEKIQWAYKKPNAYIFDYEWLEEGVLLLLEENKKYKLRWIDDNEITILETLIPAQPEKFHKDCFNNISILYKDSAYQVYVNYDQLKLMSAVERQNYNAVVIPCVTALKQIFYFQNYSHLNKAITYLAIDTVSKKQRILQSLFNKDSYYYAKSVYEGVLNSAGYNINKMGNISVSELSLSRKAQNDLWFYQMVLSKPIYGPLFKIRDSVFVFDYVNDTGYVFNDSSKAARKFPIPYHHQKDWGKELLLDHVTQNLYAKFIKDGLTYLCDINLNTGKLNRKHKLEKHVFLNTIKVKDGYAYYLYKDKIDNPYNYLYRQRLD